MYLSMSAGPNRAGDWLVLLKMVVVHDTMPSNQEIEKIFSLARCFLCAMISGVVEMSFDGRLTMSGRRTGAENVGI